MKLTYTEFRPSVNSTEVEELAFIRGTGDFREAIAKELKTCMNNYSYELAHKLLDWHEKLEGSGGIKVGAKLVYHYGTAKDGVGTYELVN